MTTAHRTLWNTPRRAALAWAGMLAAQALVLFALLWLIAGCESSKPVVSVQMPPSPYGEGPVVWAVAPVRNETGTSAFDELAFTDALVEQLQEVKGLLVLPTNRTLGAMRALRVGSLDTPEQALALAQAMNADGLIVATATAWEPYDPPKIGATIALYARSERMKRPTPAMLDPGSLQSAATEPVREPEWTRTGPVSLVSALLDAADEATRERIRRYAEGRYERVSALGWQRYTASVRLYAKFACFEMVERLIAEERSRLGRIESRGTVVESR